MNLLNALRKCDQTVTITKTTMIAFWMNLAFGTFHFTVLIIIVMMLSNLQKKAIISTLK